MNKKYLLEGIMFLSYVFFAMSWVAGTSFMANIMHEMNIHGLAEASLISTSITLAKIIGTAVAAWTIYKFGIRNSFTAASLLICFGLFTPYTSNFYVLLITRFVMGLGGALILVYFNPITIKIFEPSEWPLINGLNAVAFNVGTALTLYFLNPISVFLGGWKQALAFISLCSIILFILWVVFGKLDEKTRRKSSFSNPDLDSNYRIIDGLKDPFNWKFAMTYAGLLAFYVVLFTFYPRAGISDTKIVILFGIIGTVIGIIYSKKIPQRIPIIRISGLIQIIAIIILNFSNPHSYISIIDGAVLGLFMFIPLPALITLGQERPNMSSKKVSVTFSLFWCISYLIATIIPTIFGEIVDAFNGNFTYGFIFITIVSTTFFIGSFILPETHKKLKT